MTIQKKDPAHEELLSVLRAAKNRLEYVTPNDWILIVDRAKRVVFKKGDAFIQSGKQQKAVYLLAKGKAKVESSTKMLIAQLEPGEICGEMAFLENGIASANVTATSDVEACAIEGSALLDLFELYPHLGSRFYRSLAVNLSRRMREVIAPKLGGAKVSG
jgi:CRP-like cAMP-binding protein